MENATFQRKIIWSQKILENLLDGKWKRHLEHQIFFTLDEIEEMMSEKITWVSRCIFSSRNPSVFFPQLINELIIHADVCFVITQFWVIFRTFFRKILAFWVNCSDKLGKYYRMNEGIIKKSTGFVQGGAQNQNVFLYCQPNAKAKAKAMPERHYIHTK